MAHLQQQLNCRHGALKSTKTLNSTFYDAQQRRLLRSCKRATPAAAAAAAAAEHTSTSTSSSNAPPAHNPHASRSSTQSTCMQAWWSRVAWELLLLVSSLPAVPAALAEEGLKYDSTRGEGIVKTLSGAAYIGLLLYFLFRVLNRRARKAREERLAGQGPVRTVFTTLIEKATEGKERPSATAGAAFIGAVQAGLIGFGLFVFASKVEGIISGQDLPAGYTARNIAITVRTIIVGLTYLATFIFSANAVGLTGLGIQLLLFPDSLPDEEPNPASRLPKEPQLPKVTVTSSTEDIRAAFEAVKAQSSSSSNGSSASTAAAAAAAAASAAASEDEKSSLRTVAGATGSSDTT